MTPETSGMKDDDYQHEELKQTQRAQAPRRRGSLIGGRSYKFPENSGPERKRNAGARVLLGTVTTQIITTNTERAR